MKHCCLGVSCPPEWAKSMHPDVVCHACWTKDVAAVREEVAAEERWRAERWEGAKERIELMAVRARRNAEHEALVGEVKRLKGAVIEKQTRRNNMIAKVDALRRRLASARKAREKQLQQAATPSAAEVYTPAPRKLRKDEAVARHRVIELTQQRIRDLRQVVPLRMCDHTHHTGVVVCEGLCIPVSIGDETIQAFSGARISAAVGLIARATNVLAQILDVPLPYEVHEYGSHSTVAVRLNPDEATSATSWGMALSQLPALSSLFTQPSHKAGAASVDLALPLWVSDDSDDDHRTKFLQGVAVLNVNIAAILHAVRVRITPYTPPTARTEDSRGRTVFTLLHCLSQFITSGELQGMHPPGTVVFRGQLLQSAKPAAPPPLLPRWHSGVYFGTFNVRQGRGAAAVGDALQGDEHAVPAGDAVPVYYCLVDLTFGSDRTISGRLHFACIDVVLHGGGGAVAEADGEAVAGRYTPEGFTLLTDSSTFQLAGTIAQAAVPVLRGTWGTPLAPHLGMSASPREFVLHMRTTPFVELSPACQEGKHEPVSSVQAAVQSQDYLLNDAYFGQSRPRDGDEPHSEGSDGWEILDHGWV
eukprot:TRINITY_DN27164_c0_g1_i1.p1 TRINITY_DN27164_c0_g1~~TRINITY_DN27164_c0_g1_i1.p1  ORF type:complete len:588 (+),score=176.16 TRINITY_DN27164_c0_g1_i1:141-1904(+)